MRTLNKILTATIVSGLISWGVGTAINHKLTSYIGAGTAIAGFCGNILTSKYNTLYKYFPKNTHLN